MTEDTAERILAFIDAWPNFTHHDDHIVGLKGHGYDGELLCSDIRAALEDRDRLRAAARKVTTAWDTSVAIAELEAALELSDG